MARKLLKDTCETARAIIDGELDADLDYIAQAIRARQKSRFRPGARVRLVGTHNVTLEGVEGVVEKVNTKTITVGVGARDRFGYERSFNVPPSMLETVSTSTAPLMEVPRP